MRFSVFSLTLLLSADIVAYGAPFMASGSHIARPLPTSRNTSQAQILSLRYARSEELLKLMQWNTPAASLPQGVRQVRPVLGMNALIVVGTPGGIARVQNIVQSLDIKPSFVGIRVQCIRAIRAEVDAQGISFNLIPVPGKPASSKSFYQIASGEPALLLFQRLTQAHPNTNTEIKVVTINNVAASFTARATFSTLGAKAEGHVQYPIGIKVGGTVTPRINSDKTITLAFSPSVAVDGFHTRQAQEPAILQTVHDGEMMVLTGFEVDAQTEILLFVTPTLQ